MNYSPSEELANSLTHGFGALLGLVAIPAMVAWTAIHGSVAQLWGVSIFGFSMLMLYTASTLYHSITDFRLKKAFQLIDHISIFFLIGGSYTPFMLTFLNNRTGYTVLAIIWGLALVGILYKVFFIGRNKWVGVVLYLAMGWLVVFVGEDIVSAMSRVALYWLVAGGLSYTLGVIFYKWEKLRFHHAIWHLFVLGGTACHYVALMLSIG